MKPFSNKSGSATQPALIVDWGGVLMRTEDQAPRQAWDRRLGRAPGTVELVVHGIDAWREAQLGRCSPGDYWRAVGQELHLSPEELAGLSSDFYSGDRLDRSLVALLRRFRQRSIQIGLLSNNTLDILDQIDALGIRPLFDACVISAEIGVMKPAPEAYHAILTRLDLSAAYSLFVDDSPPNVTGAEGVGMKSVLFLPGMALSETIEGWLSNLA
jgi:putative hydrolase of the HAD superfamily